MAKDIANTVSGFAWRCLALSVGFALLVYGHHVINDSGVFGIYVLLCMFAVTIVFYQTAAKATIAYDNNLQQVDGLGAMKHLKQLSRELALLENEYKEDMARLERNWL